MIKKPLPFAPPTLLGNHTSPSIHNMPDSESECSCDDTSDEETDATPDALSNELGVRDICLQRRSTDPAVQAITPDGEWLLPAVPLLVRVICCFPHDLLRVIA